jgi:hypothetical protein
MKAGAHIGEALHAVYSADARWTPDEAMQWKRNRPWIMGCNFTPSYAINPIETWAAETFDAAVIDRELAMAASLGMNTARTYLHNVPWEQDREGFLERIAQYLDIAGRHGISTMFVLFDSCWQPEPKAGPQPDPVPGVHNSGWVQCPGMTVLMDAQRHAALKDYVRSIVSRFAQDDRILAWDVWNEPDNGLEVSSCDPEVLGAKAGLVLPLLRDAFGWVRSERPRQPLTSGIWLGDWSTHEEMTAMQRDQIDLSDVVSFHNYDPAPEFARRVDQLRRYGRPLICTEFMARPTGSTFEAILPVAKDGDVGAICWGLVDGRTQTRFSWTSWKTPDPTDAPWFHDVLRPDMTPYDPLEAEFLRRISAPEETCRV